MLFPKNIFRKKRGKRTVLPVNRSSAVKMALRRSKQTKFCWPFSSWQTTTILQTFIITSTDFPKSLITTMPTFDGKSEKFELLESLFQTSLTSHNQMTEDDRINYIHFLMRGDALKTFKNINGPTRENLAGNLAVLTRKYVKPQSMATAKHKFQKLVSNPAN